MKSSKWNWAGHLTRRTDDRWTTKSTIWITDRGGRNRGKPKGRWVDDMLTLTGIVWKELPIERTGDLDGSPLLSSEQDFKGLMSPKIPYFFFISFSAYNFKKFFKIECFIIFLLLLFLLITDATETFYAAGLSASKGQCFAPDCKHQSNIFVLTYQVLSAVYGTSNTPLIGSKMKKIPNLYKVGLEINLSKTKVMFNRTIEIQPIMTGNVLNSKFELDNNLCTFFIILSNFFFLGLRGLKNIAVYVYIGCKDFKGTYCWLRAKTSYVPFLSILTLLYLGGGYRLTWIFFSKKFLMKIMACGSCDVETRNRTAATTTTTFRSLRPHVQQMFVNGAIAQVALTDGKGGTFFTINWGVGMGIAMGVYVSGGVSGGHINPAVTLAMATLGKCKWIQVPAYMVAQYFGGIVGAGFVNLAYIALLLIVINAATDARNMELPKGLIPFIIGMGGATIGMAFGINTGFALNPARDLGPRIYSALAGWPDVFTIKIHLDDLLNCNSSSLLEPKIDAEGPWTTQKKICELRAKSKFFEMRGSHCRAIRYERYERYDWPFVADRGISLKFQVWIRGDASRYVLIRFVALGCDLIRLWSQCPFLCSDCRVIRYKRHAWPFIADRGISLKFQVWIRGDAICSRLRPRLKSFADDVVLFSKSPQELQLMVEEVRNVSNKVAANTQPHSYTGVNSIIHGHMNSDNPGALRIRCGNLLGRRHLACVYFIASFN
ncbi:Aquaporin-10 [Nymphon striatum]|nr:Aquaporin-10 [Nymphon striatum]